VEDDGDRRTAVPEAHQRPATAHLYSANESVIHIASAKVADTQVHAAITKSSNHLGVLCRGRLRV
jgi:hypothetical protein